MTFTGNIMDKPRNSKYAWESDLSCGWSTGGRDGRDGRGAGGRGRGTASTLSAESDIRFTRHKLSGPCRGCCAALAAFLVFLLLAAVAVYLGHMYLFRDPLNKQLFRGVFLVTAPAWPQDAAAAPGTPAYAARELFYQDLLGKLYAASELRGCFTSADILALDNVGGTTRVHFEVSFDPIFTAVERDEVRGVLERALAGPLGGGGGGTPSPLLADLIVDPNSLQIEESWVISSGVTATPPAAVTASAQPPPATAAPPACEPLSLPLCAHLPYNRTAFPNLAGHASAAAAAADLVAFRELLDAECSRLAHDFVCQLLQPRCSAARLVLPCKAYCRAFHAGCGDRLPERLQPYFDCSRFPDYHGPGSCSPEPKCDRSLEWKALSRRLCDGTADCADAADERGCAHCSDRSLRCSLHARCVSHELRCDGVKDCPDGSDEAGCLWLSESLGSWQRETSESPLGAARAPAGYALWAERGRVGKVCAAPHHRDQKALFTVATSLCRALTFSSAVSAEVVADSEEYPAHLRPQYVEVEDPGAAEISFLQSDCPDGRVLRVACQQLECGTPSARGDAADAGAAGLARSARPGDWPWQAALLRAHVHACDATLVHPQWLLTTTSCFQGQAKAEWTARLGTVRIQSTSPWQQERRIIGMLKSPVEGSAIALIKMETPFIMTDFVRPVCLPEVTSAQDGRTCNTLGWTRNRDQLQRVHVVESHMERCENVSIATVHGLCADALYEQDDCDEEEYAGSSMVCFDASKKRWSIAGVSNWRIACTKIGAGRPRIYDSVASTNEWIKKTIADQS